MRIVSLAARRYRTLEEIEINFPVDYCTLSGHNNAGKSSVIRLLRFLLEQGTPLPMDSVSLDYAVDRTQWIKEDKPIEVEYAIRLNPKDDSSLIAFIKKFAVTEIPEDTIECQILFSVDSQNKRTQKFKIGSNEIPNTQEIMRRLRSSNSLFLHNSTLNSRDFFLTKGGRVGSAYPIALSAEERRVIEQQSKEFKKRSKS